MKRIAVLVSVAGVLGVAFLGSAGSASAATVANCTSQLTPKGGTSSTNAKLTFRCDGPVRAYTVGATSPIKSYGPSSATLLTCEGQGVGFGCGVLNRAAPGTQVPGTTGWETSPPPPNAGGSNATDVPTTCNGYVRTQGGGTPNPGPNLTTIVTPACSQLIPAGTKVSQSIKFKHSPCGTQVNLFVGGEPGVTSFIAPVSGNADPTKNGPGGESTTVGEYLQAPQPVSMKAYKGCQQGGSGGKNGVAGAKKSATPATHFPVVCGGSITPSETAGDAKLAFTCSQNIRAFAIYSNVQMDLPGDEPIVTGNGGGKTNEGAIQQCEGPVPGAGYGCGTVDRQIQTATLPNGNTLSAGNTATQTTGFFDTPCKRKGQAKPKAWIVAMGEPQTSATTVGEWTSAPQPISISGFKCGGGKKK